MENLIMNVNFIKYLSTLCFIALISSCYTRKIGPHGLNYKHKLETEQLYGIVVQDSFVSVNEIRAIRAAQLSFKWGDTYLTSNAMFRKFGKWGRLLEPSNQYSELFYWEKVDLLEDGRLYDVYAFGTEFLGGCYAAIMVFDDKGNDLLADDSMELDNLTSYFIDLVNDYYKKDFDFFEAYWLEVNPRHWERIKDIVKENVKGNTRRYEVIF